MNDIPGVLIFWIIGYLIIRYITNEKFMRYKNYLSISFLLITASILFLRIPFLFKVLTFSVETKVFASSLIDQSIEPQGQTIHNKNFQPI